MMRGKDEIVFFFFFRKQWREKKLIIWNLLPSDWSGTFAIRKTKISSLYLQAKLMSQQSSKGTTLILSNPREIKRDWFYLNNNQATGWRVIQVITGRGYKMFIGYCATQINKNEHEELLRSTLIPTTYMSIITIQYIQANLWYV